MALVEDVDSIVLCFRSGREVRVKPREVHRIVTKDANTPASSKQGYLVYWEIVLIEEDAKQSFRDENLRPS